MREIIFDTETTGLDPAKGDRLVEIGCVELWNLIPTGESYQVYLDPERDMPAEAFAVHGLSREFLTGKPLFKEIVDGFLHFLGDARLVAHNADFDIKFLNAELQRVGRDPLSKDRVVDTLALARRKHPGATNSLDALCARYKVDNTRRTKHGALLDSEILAEVYAELCGGRQTTLTLQPAMPVRAAVAVQQTEAKRALPLASTLTAQEAMLHAKFTESLGSKAFWNLYMPQPPTPEG